MAVHTPVFIEESHGYRIEVKTSFDFMRSNPLQGQYLFEYHITITNIKGIEAQLLKRTWHIEDALGEVRQVHGPGVVGHTPYFKLNDSFHYSSFCPLPTLTGKMWGHFEMLSKDGKTFDITTPVFKFAVPEELIDRY
jgi:ApaG protein